MNNPLILASLNLPGFGRDMLGVRKRREVRDFFQEFHPKPEIILMQEHKLSLEKGKKYLLGKGGELIHLSNFRPISILGLVYKIIAKLLAKQTIFFEDCFCP